MGLSGGVLGAPWEVLGGPWEVIGGSCGVVGELLGGLRGCFWGPQRAWVALMEPLGGL